MNTVFFIVCDGLGDRPVKELDGKTPLEVAHTPNLDRLAQKGISGALHPIDVGIRPGSDTAHLSLFGYDVERYYTGRGPFEVAGIGMKLMPGDVCLRVNLGTVDERMRVVDRRAGRIDDTSEFARVFDATELDGVRFFLKAGTGHRLGMVMRGKEVSAAISDGDPHVTGVAVEKINPKNKSQKAKFTARILNTFLTNAYATLQKLPSNKRRVKEGKLPANYFLVRGAGVYPTIPSFKDTYGFKAAAIAGAGLYKGIGRILGMDVISVKGATGKPDSDLTAKVKAALAIRTQYDFIFIHFKGADTCGEDGDCIGKKAFIEKIDRAIGPLLKLKDVSIVVTADHSTPCALKAHSADDVPVVIYSEGVRDDDVEHFNERECARGRLGHIRGIKLMPLVLNLLGRAPLYGA